MTLRVLHGPSVVGGNAVGLARAEREIGLDSRCVALWPSAYGYPADETMCASSGDVWAVERARWRLLRRAVKESDVVHFNWGRGFLPVHEPDLLASSSRGRALRWAYAGYARLTQLRDLPVLARAGKRIFVTFQGDDARQGDRLRSFRVNPLDEVGPGYYTAEGDRAKRARIERFARFATKIYAVNPDLLHVLPKGSEFVPYASVDPREWRPTGPTHNARPVVVHAPSHRGVKGTRFVLEAVDRLRAQGVDFEFVLVEGMTQEEARRQYERADLVVDQLLLGWYGGFAVEAMALGKPVVCYIRDEDLGFIPPEMARELPFIRAEPGDVEQVLRTWLTQRLHELPGVGQRGRRFVERWHDPRDIATRLARDYQRTVNAQRPTTNSTNVRLPSPGPPARDASRPGARPPQMPDRT